jgi:hypothetical protein
MLLQEAAGRPGAGIGMPALGRPTCMALPAALQHGTLTSLGSIGNRVCTGLGEDEMYVVGRGKDLEAVAEALTTIENANAALEEYAATALNGLKIWWGKTDRNIWPTSGQFTSQHKSGEVTNEFLSSGGDPNRNCGIGSQDRQGT